MSVESDKRLEKCPHCGSTDFHYDAADRVLRCAHCRSVFEPDGTERPDPVFDELDKDSDEVDASGKIEGEGSVAAVRCPECGMQTMALRPKLESALCPWCRASLKEAEAVSREAIPGRVAPFAVKREAAFETMQNLLRPLRRYAYGPFKDNLKPENIRAVHIPYLVADVGARVKLEGMGEKTIRSGLTVEYDVYRTAQEFDAAAFDLPLELRRRDGDKTPRDRAGGVADDLIPFDSGNAVAFRPELLENAVLANRKLDAKRFLPNARGMALSAAKRCAVEEAFDRGVSWDSSEITVKGVTTRSIGCPVWVYGCLIGKGKKQRLLWLAVNGVDGARVGFIPCGKAKLAKAAALISLIFVFCALWLRLSDSFWQYPSWLLAAYLGPRFYWSRAQRYGYFSRSRDWLSAARVAARRTRRNDNFLYRARS